MIDERWVKIMFIIWTMAVFTLMITGCAVAAHFILKVW